VYWGADDRGDGAAGELLAERWLYQGTEESEEGGVTRGPGEGSGG